MKFAHKAVAAVIGVATLVVSQNAFADRGNSRNTPFYGNVASSAYADRLTLGSDGTSCTITVEPGRAGGKFAAPIAVKYSIPGYASFGATGQCPDLGVTLPVKGRLYDDIAVTWFESPLRSTTQNIYLLRNFFVYSSAAGESFPSVIGTQDLNGDGSADVWESTDEGEGFRTFVHSGTTLVPGAANFSDYFSADSNYSFANVDGQPGTDIIAPYFNTAGRPSTWSSGVQVVSGATGATTVLETDPTTLKPFTAVVGDVNGDGKPDITVTGGGGATPSVPRVYLNNGAGGFSTAG